MQEYLKIRPNLKLILVFSFFSVFLFGLLSFHMFNRLIEESRTKFDIPTFLVLSFFLYSSTYYNYFIFNQFFFYN